MSGPYHVREAVPRNAPGERVTWHEVVGDRVVRTFGGEFSEVGARAYAADLNAAWEAGRTAAGTKAARGRLTAWLRRLFRAR